MQNFEWVFKSESDTEKIFEIKKSSEYIRVCTPAENKQLNDRYENLKHNPRVGIYQIKDVHQQKKNNASDNETVARVSYKEKSDKRFVDMGLSIRLQPLFNFDSECLNGNKLRYKKTPYDLVNKIIQVQSCKLIDSEYNGQISKKIQVKWSVLSEQTDAGSNLGDEPDPYVSEDFEEGDPKEIFDPEDFDPEELFDQGILFDPDNIDPEELFDPENIDIEDIKEVELFVDPKEIGRAHV